MSRIVTIIPGLVSAESDVTSLHCFPLSRDFLFFPSPTDDLPFHYRIKKTRLAPVEFETVRSGWHSWHAGVFSYERPFPLGRLGMRVSPGLIESTPSLLRIPFSIGGIRTAGELTFARIAWDLYQAGYMILRGCAWQDGGGRVHALAMPSMNGKTSLIASILAQDEAALLVAEDLLVCKPGPNGIELFPTAPFFTNQGRRANRSLAAFASRVHLGGQALITPRLFFATNSTADKTWTARKSLDFALTNGLFFLHDPMIQLEMLVSGGVADFFDQVSSRIAILGDSIIAVHHHDMAHVVQTIQQG